MDVLYQFEGIVFEWDSEKAASNQEKHGLSFTTACEVFLDPLVRITDASVSHEQRFAAVVATRDRDLLYVVHLEFAGSRVRVISARRASRAEKKTYEDNG